MLQRDLSTILTRRNATWYKISDVLAEVSRFEKLTDTKLSRSLADRELIPSFIPGFDDKKDIPRFYY